MQPSTASTVRDASGQVFVGHGRSPSIEMRHTVDDKLLVGTHASFCSFRALMHRNGDTIVLLSDVGNEVRVRGPSIPRGVVITDCHVYVMSLPSNVLFAPASAGGCFSMKEFSRLCTVETTPHAVLQFVNGVVTLVFNSLEDVARLGEVVYSATGVRSEKITEEDLEVAQNGQHYAREGKRYAVSIAPSAASKASKRESVPSIGTSTIAGKRVTGSGASEAGSSSPQVVETMLRHILGGRSGDYEKNFPDEMCQTDPWRGIDASVAVCPQTVDRGSSPVGFAEEAADKQSDTSASDFDPSDVWRSLHSGGKHADHPPAPLKKTLTASRFDPLSVTVSGGGGGNSTGGTPTSTAQLVSSKSAPSLQRKLSFAAKQQQQEEDEAAAEEQKAAGRVTQLDSFLGVLATFLPQLQAQGIDGLTKLLRLSETEIDDLMDTVGMHKQGHRIMFVNKIALAKQSRNKK